MSTIGGFGGDSWTRRPVELQTVCSVQAVELRLRTSAPALSAAIRSLLSWRSFRKGSWRRGHTLWRRSTTEDAPYAPYGDASVVETVRRETLHTRPICVCGWGSTLDYLNSQRTWLCRSAGETGKTKLGGESAHSSGRGAIDFGEQSSGRASDFRNKRGSRIAPKSLLFSSCSWQGPTRKRSQEMTCQGRELQVESTEGNPADGKRSTDRTRPCYGDGDGPASS